MISNVDALRDRNRAWADRQAWRHTPRMPFLPQRGLYVLTCIDPRVDPAQFLGLDFADAIVARTVGGRVTPATIQDIAYIGYLVQTEAPEGPYFEVAIIHHTDCGSALLADEKLRRDFAGRSGYDENGLARLPVLDPAASVRHDVGVLLAAPQISSQITVSGHSYDVNTGMLTTITSPLHPQGAATSDVI